MTYSLGGTIEASDYNNLISQINYIFGVGYGNAGYGGNSVNVADAGNLDSISKGDEITNEMWLNLRNAISDCADHQGTTLTNILPSLTDLEDGDLATFFPLLNSSTNIFDLTVNRHNTDGVFNLPSSLQVLQDTRTTNWSSFIQHVFSIKFLSSDYARYFFNTGGSIQISASRVGGTSSPQGVAWDSIITGNDFTFTGEHYFALTSAPENLRPQISPLSGAYAAFGASVGSIWTILGQRVGVQGPTGGNGSEIKIYSNFLDGGTNAPDIIDGQFKSTITEKKHTLVFDVESPIYSTITHLSSGN